MVDNINRKKIIGFRITIIFIPVIFFVFYINYVQSTKFYGSFSVKIYEPESYDVPFDYKVFGLSYFGDTIYLEKHNNRFESNVNTYYVDLGVIVNYIQQRKLVAEYTNETLQVCAIDSISDNSMTLFDSCDDGTVKDKIQSIGILGWMAFFVLISFVISAVAFIKAGQICLFISKKKTGVNKMLVIAGLILSVVLLPLVWQYFSGNNQGKCLNAHAFKDSVEINYSVGAKCNEYLISIEDTSGNGLTCIFNVNGKFWFNWKSMFDYIHAIPVEDTFGTRKEIIQAWKFVSSSTYHGFPDSLYYENILLHKPGILLNSTGFGICADRSYALSSIAENLGYKTRIINIKDMHTFIEVYDGIKWVMFDPDYGLLFVDSSRKAGSLSELRNGSHIIPVSVAPHRFICNFENVIIPYPVRLQSIYASDSLTSFFEIRNKKLSDACFKLPPGTKIKFPTYSGDICMLKVFIPGFYNGKVEIPLLIYSVKNNTIPYTDSLSNSGLLSGPFYICGNDIEIFAFINPLLFYPDEGQPVVFKIFSVSGQLPLVTITEVSNPSNMFRMIPALTAAISENAKTYMKYSDNYLKILHHKISKWEHLEQIINMHTRNKIYSSMKMNALKEMFFCNIEKNEMFYEWINAPENIALILIIFDKFDDEQIIGFFGKI